MSGEAPLATFEVRRGELAGSHLSLFGSSLVHRSGDRFESIYLDRIGAFGVAYERDLGRMAWGCALLFIAVALFVIFWPLRMLVASMAGEVTAQAQGTFLPAALRVFDLCVSLLPFAGVAIAVWAIAWLVLGWIGETALSVGFASGERVFASRGRDPLLYEFGESVSARISARG